MVVFFGAVCKKSLMHSLYYFYECNIFFPYNGILFECRRIWSFKKPKEFSLFVFVHS